MIEWKDKAITLAKEGCSWKEKLQRCYQFQNQQCQMHCKYFKEGIQSNRHQGKWPHPKVLFLDIETKYITTNGVGIV